jgi:predicted small secreted protein
MDNTEIMNNEVMETTEEVIENTDTNKSLKTGVGIGLGVVVGVLAYKYVLKPIAANAKAQFKQRKKTAKEKTTCTDETVVIDAEDPKEVD